METSITVAIILFIALVVVVFRKASSSPSHAESRKLAYKLDMRAAKELDKKKEGERGRKKEEEKEALVDTIEQLKSKL